MSGRKQHHIPQHYQKPFAIKGTNQKVWVYRKGKLEPIPASIGDTAAQRDFYSKPSENGLPTLDDLITEYEQKMHVKVDKIRELNVGESIDPMAIAEIITHLLIRSSYMRGMVEDAAESMAVTIEATVKGNIDGRAIKFPMHKVPPSIETMNLEEFDSRGLSKLTPVDGKTLSKLLYFALREGSDHFLAEARDLVEHLNGELSVRSEQFSQKAQTSALSESMAPAARTKKLALLDWHVEASSNGQAVLPDCTSIAFDGKDWTSLLFTNTDELEAVVLPLTPDRLAVGVRKGCSAPNLSAFDEIAARASHSFFLSSVRCTQLDNFLPWLGGTAKEQVSSMTKGAMVQALDDLLKADPHPVYGEQAQRAAGNSWSHTSADEPINWSVELFDFGDVSLARDIAEALNPLLIAFSKELPVGGLSGFVFAEDYRAALKSVKRGFSARRKPEPTKTQKEVGVSMPLSIREDGKVKTLIVSRSSIAMDLISNDEDASAEALSIILHGLASTALTSLMNNKFPDQMLAEVSDDYEKTIFQYTEGVFQSYFCAAISCSAPSFLDYYEELAFDALQSMLAVVPEERKKYRAHRDMELMFPMVANTISAFLYATARLLGALRKQSSELEESSQLLKMLEENKLLSWYEIFRKDLQSFDEGLETWAHFDEAFFVNRHFERIAVQFGIVPEPTVGNGAYVHVVEMPNVDLL